jgi:hypothetical protein
VTELTRRAEVLDERRADLRAPSTRSVTQEIPQGSVNLGETHLAVRLSIQTESDVARGSGRVSVRDHHCMN